MPFICTFSSFCLGFKYLTFILWLFLQSLYGEVRQLLHYVREAHGGVFRRVALSGLIDSAGKGQKELKDKEKMGKDDRYVWCVQRYHSKRARGFHIFPWNSVPLFIAALTQYELIFTFRIQDVMLVRHDSAHTSALQVNFGSHGCQIISLVILFGYAFCTNNAGHTSLFIAIYSVVHYDLLQIYGLFIFEPHDFTEWFTDD